MHENDPVVIAAADVIIAMQKQNDVRGMVGCRESTAKDSKNGTAINTLNTICTRSDRVDTENNEHREENKIHDNVKIKNTIQKPPQRSWMRLLKKRARAKAAYDYFRITSQIKMLINKRIVYIAQNPHARYSGSVPI